MLVGVMQRLTFFDTDNGKPGKINGQFDNLSERRRCERRQSHCEGYVKIPAVGWYCRRLKIRRKTDFFR